MRTESQIEASRANGAKSRGPVTAEGKHNSSRNAIKHGLLAETVVLKGELEERFIEVLADLEQELQPETPIECTLVEKMAVARWRQRRLWGMEKAAMDYQVRNQAAGAGRGEHNATRASLAFSALGDSRSLDLFIRYDSLCDRQYLRAHKRFLELRRGCDSPAPAPSNPKPEVSPVPEAFAPETPEPGQPRSTTRMGPVHPGTGGRIRRKTTKRTQQLVANKATALREPAGLPTNRRGAPQQARPPAIRPRLPSEKAFPRRGKRNKKRNTKRNKILACRRAISPTA
jgi:hypothetical protein